jgi:hypothetical protein
LQALVSVPAGYGGPFVFQGFSIEGKSYQLLATDTLAWSPPPQPVDVLIEVTRCQVTAEVPEVAWQTATTKSPTFIPTALLPGLPKPQPAKKLAASTALWICVLSYANNCLPSVKPNITATRGGFVLEYAILVTPFRFLTFKPIAPALSHLLIDLF